MNGITKSNLFTFPIGNVSSKLIFTLIPVEGNADLLVNPGFEPKSNDDYYYRSSGSVGKRVIIGKEDIESFRLKNSSIYIKVEAPVACRYILETKVATNDMLDLRPGFSETGQINVGQVRQHLLSVSNYTGQTLTRDYTIKLQLFSGEAHL